MNAIAKIDIFRPDGTRAINTTISDTSVRVRRLMAENYIQIDFVSPDYIDIPVGSTIGYDGYRFTKTRRQTPTFNGRAWQYSEQFDDADGDLRRFRIKYYGQDFQEMSFALTATLEDFALLIVRDINKEREGSVYRQDWAVGQIDAELATTLKTISFAGDTLFDACTSIAQEYDTEWFITKEYISSEGGYERIILNFTKKRSLTEVPFELGSGKILSQMNPQRGEDGEYGTRFFVFGGTRNLTDDYRDVPAGTSVPNLYENRLRLPNNQAYINAKNGQIVQTLPHGEILEQYVTFDDIFPKNRDKVTRVDVEIVVDQDQNRYYQYTIQADDCPFAGKGDIIDELGIKFETGQLAGQEFKAKLENETLPWNKRLIIVGENMGTEGQVLYVPNEQLRPNVGDIFVLTGVKLPTSKVRDAENELLAKAEDYARQHSSDTDVYECIGNAVFCYEHNIEYGVGIPVRLVNPDLFGAGGRSSRIQGVTMSLTKPYEITWEVGDNSKYSRFGNLSTTLEEVKYSQRLGIIDTSLLNLIRSTDYSAPSDENIYTALAVYNHIYKKHDHKGRLIRPAILVMPQKSPAEEGTSLDDNEIAQWLSPEGNYPETPSGGVDTVYDLTLRNGQVTLGIYQPGVEPKSIDLSPLIQGLAAQAWVTSQLASYCNGGSYNSETKNIELKHDSTVLATIDARAFIKDGMVDSVAVENGYLVITFNTDSGKEPIRIPTSDIFDANAYLPLSAGANKPLTGNLYTRSLVPAATNATVGTATNRYNAVYAGAVEGGANNLALARTLNDVRMVGMLLGNSRLSIGDGYAENNLATYLYGATITFLLGQQKVAKWQMDGNGHLLPATASANVNIGAAAKRVANTYSQNSDTQTLNVSGKSTQAEVEVSSSLAIPTSAPTNPTTGKTYIYIDTTGNYTE